MGKLYIINTQSAVCGALTSSRMTNVVRHSEKPEEI